MPKDDTVFFSIVIPLTNSPHLIRHTLYSIFSQLCPSYEIIVVARRSDHHLVDLLGESRSQIILTRAKTDHRADLMNRGLKKAKGKYVHYLFPGDTYLSPRSLLDVLALIERREVDMLYCAYLKREEDMSYAYYHPFSLHWLKKGHLFTRVQSCFFLKKRITELGSFSPNYSLVSGLDLVIKLLADPTAKTLFIKKIFTDYEMQKFTPKAIFREVFEIFLILRKNFGFFQALKWLIFQDQMKLNLLFKRVLKKSFFKS